jgi:hypothetical protein
MNRRDFAKSALVTAALGSVAVEETEKPKTNEQMTAVNFAGSDCRLIYGGIVIRRVFVDHIRQTPIVCNDGMLECQSLVEIHGYILDPSRPDSQRNFGDDETGEMPTKLPRKGDFELLIGRNKNSCIIASPWQTMATCTRQALTPIGDGGVLLVNAEFVILKKENDHGLGIIN